MTWGAAGTDALPGSCRAGLAGFCTAGAVSLAGTATPPLCRVSPVEWVKAGGVPFPAVPG